jgi:hypothetical protein
MPLSRAIPHDTLCIATRYVRYHAKNPHGNSRAFIKKAAIEIKVSSHLTYYYKKAYALFSMSQKGIVTRKSKLRKGVTL